MLPTPAGHRLPGGKWTRFLGRKFDFLEEMLPHWLYYYVFLGFLVKDFHLPSLALSDRAYFALELPRGDQAHHDGRSAQEVHAEVRARYLTEHADGNEW